MPTQITKGNAALHHHVYVIELDRAVLKEKRFLEENSDYSGEKACLYVGSTGLTPEERLKNHQAGIKSGKYPHKFGLWLRPRLYQKYNPMTYEDAAAREKQLALDLRRLGYAVWQR